MARTLISCCLLLLTISGSALRAAGLNDAVIVAQQPEGFEGLSQAREMLVDVFFGGRKITEARIQVRPGFVQFKNPQEIVPSIPGVERSADVDLAFSVELPANVALVCSAGSDSSCGQLAPEVVGVILDEDHFRLDLFINSRFLKAAGNSEDQYLAAPAASLGLTSTVGLTVSGSSAAGALYNFQNRTVLGFKELRVRSDSSYATRLGFSFNTLAAEIDRRDMRYSGGLLWAPGSDFVGRRRILGLGFTTQLDTRADRDSLRGNPIVVFLNQPARVDVLIDGRLAVSGVYDAGNNIIDTSTLPDGSYPLVLRIQERTGRVREEQRFFARRPDLVPLGHPKYFAFAGLLSNVRAGGPIALSRGLFYQAGTARRLSNRLAADLSLVGTANKAVIEAGLYFVTPEFRLRGAGLISARGDRGALIQLATSESSRVPINFDLRRVWSRAGGPLIPFSRGVETFESVPATAAQSTGGSFLQISGSIGVRFQDAYLAAVGSLRKDRGSRVDYSIGPSFNWPIVSSRYLHIALRADGHIGPKTVDGYAGVQVMFNSGKYAFSHSTGARISRSSQSGVPSRSHLVSDATAHFSYAAQGGAEMSTAAGFSRDGESTSIHADTTIYSSFGTARAQVLREIEGSARTQYGLNLQTGVVLGGHTAFVGGRNFTESAAMVVLDGNAAGARFDVLVDEQARGRIEAGQKLGLFLLPYRSYSIRLRPVDAASVWYDTAERRFTVYPGTVQVIRLQVENVHTIFGRAVLADGTSVSQALVSTSRGIGQTDEQGFFQVDASGHDVLSFQRANGLACKAAVNVERTRRELASVGKVLCQ